MEWKKANSNVPPIPRVSGLSAVLLHGSRRGGAVPAGLEAVALAVHLQGVHVVGEAIQQRAGESFRPEDLGPSSKGRLVVTRMEPRS